MTIGEINILKPQYIANGIETSYAITFPVLFEVSSDPQYSFEVIVTDLLGIESKKEYGVDYSFTYNEETRLGNVVFNTAPTSGYIVTFLMDVQPTQNSEYTNSGTDKLSGKVLEFNFDKLTLLILQLIEAAGRSIKLPKGSSLTNVTFPISPETANFAVVVNEAGDGLATKALIDINLAPVTPFIKTLLASEDAAAARNILKIARKTSVNNANYTITPLDKVIAQIGSMSAARTFTLPAANTFSNGEELIIIDFSGTVTNTNKITIARSSTDTIDGLTSIDITEAYGVLKLISDGVGRWKITNDQNDYASNAYNFSSKVTLSNNASSPNNKIDFSDSESSTLLSTKILQSSGAWAAGSGNNGLLSGSVVAGKTYHWFKIFNPSTGALDFGAIEGVAEVDPDPTSVLPSGFTKWKRVGSILTDISGDALPFKQRGRYFYYSSDILETGSIGTPNISNDLQVRTPLGISTKVIFLAKPYASTTNINYEYVVFSPLAVGNKFVITGAGTQADVAQILQGEVCTDSSSRILHNGSTYCTLSQGFFTTGYNDYNL